MDVLLGEDPDGHLLSAPAVSREDVLNRALAGGYPAVLERSRWDRRQAWFRNYVAEVVRTEVADLAAIEGLLDIPKLLRLTAHRSAGLMNTARLARDGSPRPRGRNQCCTTSVRAAVAR